MAKVYVGLSGGVDSSVTAALLKEQGHEVTGVYMKNWARDLPGFKCPWREDLADAKKVAVQLDIPFKIFDFQKEYKEQVVDYMIEAYQDGITPNPDIVCNQEVKFKLFLKAALEDGANMIATGHYAQIKDNQLLMAKDTNKDQTYFLYRVAKDALKYTMFPLGSYTKPEVRKLAKKYGLVTAEKKDSVGICFVGEIGIKQFLENFVDSQPGDVIDSTTNQVIGQHEGALFYTIGQRHGLGVGGGLPYYVIGKDMVKNQVYVTSDLHHSKLWANHLRLGSLHEIDETIDVGKKYGIRTRHRAPIVLGQVTNKNQIVDIKLDEEIRAATPGQSAVLYDGDKVVGGGIILE